MSGITLDQARIIIASALAKAAEAGLRRRAIEPDEIVERILFALVNEGAKTLEEGLALRAVDIDLIYINGYGFPAHRGGPLHYADAVGLDRVLSRLRDFERQHGPWWSPAPLLERLAREGEAFAAYDRDLATRADRR